MGGFNYSTTEWVARTTRPPRFARLETTRPLAGRRRRQPRRGVHDGVAGEGEARAIGGGRSLPDPEPATGALVPVTHATAAAGGGLRGLVLVGGLMRSGHRRPFSSVCDPGWISLTPLRMRARAGETFDARWEVAGDGRSDGDRYLLGGEVVAEQPTSVGFGAQKTSLLPPSGHQALLLET